MKIGFASALFLVLLTLKLTDLITWSWWWVLAPLWAPIAIAIPFIPWLLRIGREEKELEIKLAERDISKPSKFMQKLEEQMKESEEERKKANEERKKVRDN